MTKKANISMKKHKVKRLIHKKNKINLKNKILKKMISKIKKKELNFGF